MDTDLICNEKKMSENIVNIQSEISCPNEIENVRQKGSGYILQKKLLPQNNQTLLHRFCFC